MKKYKLLYQIKNLEKVIFRRCLNYEIIEIGLKKFRITPTQIQIIEYILENNNKDIYQKDLENILYLRRATVSGVLHTMEKNGFVERIVDKNDSRIKKIILKENVRKFFLTNIEKMQNLENIAVQGISKKDLDVFTKVIKKMKENIETNSYY